MFEHSIQTKRLPFFTRFVILCSILSLFLFGSINVSAADSDASADSSATANVSTTTAAGDNESEKNESSAEPARPETNGALHVSGTSLVDENGNPVVLQGVSTHGLTWFPDVINETLFDEISSDWNANLIRLAMYSQIYCKNDSEKEESLNLLEKGIEYAIQADMYVIVDWHILEDANPMDNLGQAVEFFQYIAGKYANDPHILFEICNEPNSGTTWEDIKTYAQTIIPVIRTYSSDSIILVGTPNYDRYLLSAAEDPLAYDNLMYTCHFYAGSHGEKLQNTLTRALECGLPVFISECGLSEESGDGELDFESGKTWFNLLKKYNLSFAVWSLSNKQESSALVRSTVSDFSHLSEKDLSSCGKWVRALLRGTDPDQILSEISFETFLIDTIHTNPYIAWSVFALIAISVIVAALIINLVVRKASRKRFRTYHDLVKDGNRSIRKAGKIFFTISIFCTLIYLTWRVLLSIPFGYGILPIIANLILLALEILGFIESLIHYSAMIGMREHPLPQIEADEFPDVDIFIATYNEPEALLRKTVIGCKNMIYPDKEKVHIYICDDNRRASMRALADEMGVNYFDRPDNKGAKAGNLNHAMGLTSSPYIVTFDADMIPRREFLIKTIPYFVDAEKRNATRPADDQIPLGFIQTPQAFYTPDVFQHNLYAETKIPNEQDFFYRTIEAAKTSSNSVIYGGSNTILSRKALEEIGGFYTESITEDFATGMLIESAGYVSLGLSEPLASGMAPSSFKEHIQQRTRWGRGVLVTARQLKFMRRKSLSIGQKLNYWGSVVYWYSPIKNLIYMISPLLYAVFAIPVFRCTATDLLIFWLPMFFFQNACLLSISRGSISTKRSSIQELAVMPSLLIPIIKESLGVTLSTFKVTDKKGGNTAKGRSMKAMVPFLILLTLNVIGLVRSIYLLVDTHAFSLIVLLFWLVRNVYLLLMCIFLVDGRTSDGENVKVKSGEMISIQKTGAYGHSESGSSADPIIGITTMLTEHNVSVYLDEPDAFRLGESVFLLIDTEKDHVELSGTIVQVKRSPNPNVPSVYTIEILDFHTFYDTYIELLYDRVPTLPQNLKRDSLYLRDIFRNLTLHLGDSES